MNPEMEKELERRLEIRNKEIIQKYRPKAESILNKALNYFLKYPMEHIFSTWNPYFFSRSRTRDDFEFAIKNIAKEEKWEFDVECFYLCPWKIDIHVRKNGFKRRTAFDFGD